MTFNTELARQVREMVHRFPEKHNQQVWASDPNSNPADPSCGTTACLAGWTAAVKGYTVAQVEGDPGLRDRGVYSVALYAGRELGLTEGQRDTIFYTLSKDRALKMLDALIETDGAIDVDELEEI